MRNFNQISIFVEVVNRNSFAGAARQLGISPPAVSKQILALEKELGLSLIKRSTRRIELTPEGQLYYEQARRVLSTVRQAEAAISQASEEPSGILKIICGPHFGDKHILPYLNEFLERYPKICPEIYFFCCIPDLDKEKIDLVIGPPLSIPSNCIKRRLLTGRKTLCASPAYLKKYGTPQKPSDLIHHKIVAHCMNRPKDTLMFKKGESVHFEPIAYFNDSRAIRSCVLEGAGIAELRDYIIEEDMKNGSLVEVLSKYMGKDAEIPIYAGYPQTDYVHLKVRRFIDFIVEKMKLSD